MSCNLARVVNSVLRVNMLNRLNGTDAAVTRFSEAGYCLAVTREYSVVPLPAACCGDRQAKS